MQDGAPTGTERTATQQAVAIIAGADGSCLDPVTFAACRYST